ncbi:MAG: hypothetical protein M1457_04435 [bacterium]|nr:hypothetical protein [bacterium]
MAESRPERIDVIAHRGASAQAPENTLAAFRLAHEMGADWFELDCQFSRDGHLVVMHDGQLDRTTNGRGPVAARTLAELRRLDAGGWFDPRFAGEPVPTLGEALDFAHGRLGVYIEVKTAGGDADLERRILEMTAGAATLDAAGLGDVAALIGAAGSANLGLAHQVVAEVRRCAMERHVVIQSFSPIVCALACRESAAADRPPLRVELLCSKDKNDPGHWTRVLRWAALLGVAGLNPHMDAADAQLASECRRAGRRLTVWTADDPAHMRALAGLGVDGIITNHPARCLAVLRELGRHE